jgi:hypothetical protein
MTLQPSGVQLVVADQQAFLQALAAANGAVSALGVGSASAAQKIDQLSARIEFQKRSLGILAQELTATTAKYGEGSIQAQKKQLAVDKLTASLAKDESALSQLRAQEAAATNSSQQLAQGLDKAGQSGTRMGEVMTGALRKVGELAVNALASAGRAVVDFVRGSEEAAKQYQKTMAEIVGLTGTSTQAVGQLSQQVLQLAGPVAKAPQELADALYFVLSSGVDAAHAMDVVTASAKASAAGLGETKIVADLVTSVMNAYGQQNISAAHATDILTQAVKDGKGEPDAYAAALGRVLPIASAAGVNFEQVAASIATMTRTGLDANEATTALRGIIGSLEAPVAKTRSALHRRRRARLHPRSRFARYAPDADGKVTRQSGRYEQAGPEHSSAYRGALHGRQPIAGVRRDPGAYEQRPGRDGSGLSGGDTDPRFPGKGTCGGRRCDPDRDRIGLSAVSSGRGKGCR